MTTDLFQAHFEDPAVAARFAPDAWVRALLRVEIALARAQAKCGLIPPGAASRLEAAVERFQPDWERLHAAIARDGFPIIGLMAQVREKLEGDEAARWLHWGATTQDIVDTALVTQLDGVLDEMEVQLILLTEPLATLARRHRDTLMVGRTHLQPAVPITFGLKAAGWLAPLLRQQARLAELRPRLLVVQCGGAAGTLAAWGERGLEVARNFAGELGLGLPAMPWHAQRDNLLEVAGWCALFNQSLAKFAQDVLLLSQAEIGELREGGGDDAGGSSAMPQKSNPVTSESILVATRLAGTHHAGLLGAPPAEHERGTQNGHLELVHLPRLCALTAGALRAAERLARELVVDAARMQENLAATRGVLLAEAAALALSWHLDPNAARQLVRECCRRALAEKRPFLALLRTHPAAQPALCDLPRDESDALGSARELVDRVLAAVNTVQSGRHEPQTAQRSFSHE